MSVARRCSTPGEVSLRACCVPKSSDCRARCVHYNWGGGWGFVKQRCNRNRVSRSTGRENDLKPCILLLCINIAFLEGKKCCQLAPNTPKFSSLPREYGGTVEGPLGRHLIFVVANRTLKQQNSHSCLGNTEVRRRTGLGRSTSTQFVVTFLFKNMRTSVFPL